VLLLGTSPSMEIVLVLFVFSFLLRFPLSILLHVLLIIVREWCLTHTWVHIVILNEAIFYNGCEILCQGVWRVVIRTKPTRVGLLVSKGLLEVVSFQGGRRLLIKKLEGILLSWIRLLDITPILGLSLLDDLLKGQTTWLLALCQSMQWLIKFDWLLHHERLIWPHRLTP
jgi:hypothetical protein